MSKLIFCAAISMLALSTAMAAPAYAKSHTQLVYDNDGKTRMAIAGTSNRAAAAHQHRWTKTGRRPRLVYRHRNSRVYTNVVGGAVTQLPHPTGCPHYLFCGCGAASEVFGTTARMRWNSWLAASWYRFPRDNPAPGRVGVRPHHVVVLRQHIKGNIWLVASYNGGRHKSWLIPMNIASYTIVNPHSGRYASL